MQIFLLKRIRRNHSNSSISQSLTFLRKVRNQPPPPTLELSHISVTLVSLGAARLNREGKERLKASSPHQGSFQKINLLPSPRGKNCILEKGVPIFSDFFPNAYTKPSPNITCALTPFNLPKIFADHCSPQRVSLIGKLPTPFTKQSLIQ